MVKSAWPLAADWGSVQRLRVGGGARSMPPPTIRDDKFAPKNTAHDLHMVLYKSLKQLMKHTDPSAANVPEG